MTESNRTYRKSSRNTAIAAVLGGVAICASGYLVFAVNSLDHKYGRIAEDFEHYNGQLQTTRAHVATMRQDLTTLSDQKANLTQEVALAEASRRSAAQQEADAQARLAAARDELAGLQERLAEARQTISQADRLTRENEAAQSRRAALESEAASPTL